MYIFVVKRLSELYTIMFSCVQRAQRPEECKTCVCIALCVVCCTKL